MHFFITLMMFITPLFSSQQILLVLAPDFNSSEGVMQRYEADRDTFVALGDPISVNLGRNGLGWDNSPLPFETEVTDPQKQEGDGRAPAGVLPIETVFGRAASVNTAMPYLQTTPELICVDDVNASTYNEIVATNGVIDVKSFEWMQREDGLYTIGIRLGHNPARVPGRGSCVFIHLQKAPHAPTSGCTSMSNENMQIIVEWLKPKAEPVLVQVPQSYCNALSQTYPGIDCD